MTTTSGRICLLTGTSVLTLWAAPTLAQEAPIEPPPQAAGAAPQSASLLDEIVVTANRRSERLQNVGIAATAFSGEQMSSLGFTQTTDIVKQTPAVSFYQFSPSVSNINIRGVVQNDFADHLEPPIAVYQDEGYVGSSGGISVPIFDLERVEVLRGPQGTLFGRNATGGILHFISTDPKDAFGGYGQVSYGSFDTYNIQGAVGGQITDRIRGRLAFTRNLSDGPYTNVVSGADAPGNTDNYGIRAKLAVDLTERTELLLTAKYYNNDEHGPGYSFAVARQGADGLGVAVAPNEVATFPNIVTGGTVTAACPGCNVVGYAGPGGDPWTIANSYPGSFTRDISGLQAKLTHTFDAVVFTSVTDFLRVDKDILYDTDMSPAQFFVYGTSQRYDQISQELRLNGETDRLKWVAGLYYLNMDGRYGSTVDLDLSSYVGAPICTGAGCPAGGNAPAHFQTDYQLETESYAVFAQGEYALSDQLSLTLGARYTHDSKTYDYRFSNDPVLQPDFAYNSGNTPAADRTFENVSLKAQLDYRPSEQTLLFASYTRGHKGGNWTAPVFPPIDPTTFAHDQEVLTSYEVGVKQRLFDGRARLNASVYYYDYEDYQAFSLVNIAQTIANVPATVYGAEVEFRANPFEGFEFSLTAATGHSEVEGLRLPTGVAVDRELPNVPELQLTGLVRYSWDAFGGEMSAQASGQYMGDHYLTVLNEPVNTEQAWSTLDLRLAWVSPDRRVELAAYGSNVTDEQYRVWALDVSALSLGMQVFAPPASYGVSLKYNF